MSHQATEEIEARETLALMAARSEDEGAPDGETYMEKYTRGVLQVESILSLERLRQASNSPCAGSLDGQPPPGGRGWSAQQTPAPRACGGGKRTRARLVVKRK